MPEGTTPIAPFADAVRERYRFEREIGTSAVSFKATQPLLRNLNGDPEFEAVVAKLCLPR